MKKHIDTPSPSNCSDIDCLYIEIGKLSVQLRNFGAQLESITQLYNSTNSKIISLQSELTAKQKEAKDNLPSKTI